MYTSSSIVNLKMIIILIVIRCYFFFSSCTTQLSVELPEDESDDLNEATVYSL